MKFKIDTNPCDTRKRMYTRSTVEIDKGLNVLVGCNGIGKTSLIYCIEEELDKQGIEYFEYDNKKHGGLYSASIEAEEGGGYGFLASLVGASEGETIMGNINGLAKRMIKYLNKDGDKKVFFFDAVDSGFSIDNIIDLKKYVLKPFIAEGERQNKEVYIVVSANSYEMARGEHCIDTRGLKSISFDSYDDYCDFILNSRKLKNTRDGVCYDRD